MTTYIGPACQAEGRCGEPASQLCRWRGTEPPYGHTVERELCEAHAGAAIRGEHRPFQVKALAGWTAHKRREAAEAEAQERERTMAAQQRWNI